ncbi:MAG: class I SAM-dependent methyltransferase [Acidimicrobiia bacterium]
MRRTLGDNWDDIAAWWNEEAGLDPAYGLDVHPLLRSLVPTTGGVGLDLGCGEGQGMRIFEGMVIGVDLSVELALIASSSGPVVVADLPDLSYLRGQTVDVAYSVYLVDLIEDHAGFFRHTARVVKEGGTLVVVINHPVYTAPGSGPLMDADGEMMWRWGDYFRQGSSTEPAGNREIRYHHRSLGDLVTAAANEGWVLTTMSERGLSEATVAQIPGYVGQESVPRLLGIAWRRDSRR